MGVGKIGGELMDVDTRKMGEIEIREKGSSRLITEVANIAVNNNTCCYEQLQQQTTLAAINNNICWYAHIRRR